MAINLDKLVGFHESALTIRTERMEVIAGNLANANTPGYKARDIDFNKAMQVLASLRGPIDAYFENVTVNTDDLILRDNRLRLLSLVVKTMNMVAFRVSPNES